MNILFAGTPKTSSKILEYLQSDQDNNIVGVLTQPDKPGKRGNKLVESSVSMLARKAGLNVIKPTDLNDGSFKEKISLLDIDFLIVIAYGKLLPSWLLNISKIMSINIHFSLLPKYRGASPIQSSLLSGDKETGISFMQMSDELDSGDIISSFIAEIDSKDNKVTLEKKLTDLCIKNISKNLTDVYDKKISLLKQDNTSASYCKKISKDDALTNFDDMAVNIINKFRAFYEWPGLSFIYNGTKIRIHEILLSNEQSNNSPGSIERIDKSGIYFNTKDLMIVITYLQFPNKNKISSADAFNSYKDFFK